MNNYITGAGYTSCIIPLSLPARVYNLFVPSHLSPTALHPDSATQQEDLSAGPLDQHGQAEGANWVILQYGLQKNAGPPLLGRTFEESKLEIPFLHSSTLGEATVSYKHTLLFDSRMMAMSSQYIAGLRSFAISSSLGSARELNQGIGVRRVLYEVEKWLKVEVVGGPFPRQSSQGTFSRLGPWTENQLRSVTSSWWVGQSQTKVLTRVSHFIFSAVDFAHLKICF